MGHTVPKELYARLGKKVDNLTFRAPWNSAFFEILKSLYSAEEAEFIVRMPYGFNSLPQIQKVTGYETSKLQKLLDSLSVKGLVMDIKLRSTYRYIISPMIIGIFEYTMMRTDKNLDFKKISGLFEKYLFEFPDFYKANFKSGTKVSVSRVLPYDQAYHPDEYTEVMDYEKAEAVITNAKKFAVGTCSCRHVKHHTGEKNVRFHWIRVHLLDWPLIF